MVSFHFDNSYTRLPDPFFIRQNPVPVAKPEIVLFNDALAATLGLKAESLRSPEGAQIFSGNRLPEGADPIAQAYAGHQFGHFNMLGDGRAVLLGEHLTPDGQRLDIQLKGSGPTPFSRRGDGRAALGPMLREFIISEAMHFLDVPSTRSLAVVTTGEPVFRETPLAGAILTRVAASHLRVGTFEFAAALRQPELLRAIADYTIQRHYPVLARETEPYLALLHAVMDRQASLVARWLHIGFIHGVMNTDNVALSGETIDYGPCAFMDAFSPATVFSSIDRNGRYAFGNQARIAEWNLARFAETLLPLLHPEADLAMAKAKDALATFAAAFQEHWLRGMRAKLGLVTEATEDAALIHELFQWMEARKADYTNTFRALSRSQLDAPIYQEAEFKTWHIRWQARKPSAPLMLATNPAIIPRNHLVERALAEAVERGDYSFLLRLTGALKKPFEDPPEEFTSIPALGDYKTFCGT